MLRWFKRGGDLADRRLKLHDVEAHMQDMASTGWAGKLAQTIYSDGTGKFRIRAARLKLGMDRTARLYLEDKLVSEFKSGIKRLEYRWRGTMTAEMPKFEIGKKVRLEVGPHRFEGIVEAD